MSSPDAFQLRGINHLALVCSDMVRTVDFYTNVLDMPLVKTLDLPGRPVQHFFFDLGAGRALEEQRLGDKVSLVGSFSPGQGSALLKAGIIDGGYMWNPLEAGKVFVVLADYLAGGGKVTDGMTIDGLGVVHPDFDSGNIIVDALQPITVDTVDSLAALGL